MCGKHDIRLVFRPIAVTGNVDLAFPYCDMEELGAGAEEHSITDDALRDNTKRPN